MKAILAIAVKDLRLLVRERLVAGDSDEQVTAFVVARYGEYVLLQPKASGSNLLLWAAGPVMLILAGWTAIAFLRRRRPVEAALEPDEEKRLSELLNE